MPSHELLPELTAGSYIGQYKVVKNIGTGGYGKVYQALDKQTSTYYAIKSMCKAKPNTRQAVFQSRELSLQRLVRDHPNIVTLYHVISDDLHIHAVLDYCPGGDLFSAIVERGLFHRKDNLIKIVFTQLLDAVEYCHNKSIFHRDIKPENILCNADGTHVVLADFGLATNSRLSSEFGCGSRYYMSPECINKEFGLQSYSLLESDVWSLGVILCNLICAQNPWRYATTDDERFATFLHDPLFLRQMLGISYGTNFILRHVFELNPPSRVTISRLRQDIVALETFYKVEDEHTDQYAIKESSKVKESQVKKVTLPKIVINGISDSSNINRSISQSSTDSNLFFLSAGKHNVDKHDSGQQSSVGPPSDITTAIESLRQQLHEAGLCVGHASHGSSGSSGSRHTLATPANYDAEPIVNVEEVSDSNNLENPQEAVSERSKSGFSMPWSKESSKPSRIFRTAIKRLKMA